jgi:hypothetical protein
VASNFPTSLDNFTNPSSGNTLDSPSHSLQHSDINDAVEAMQRKVGVGTAVAGSASAGQVLTISAAGTSTWTTPSQGLILIRTQSFSAVASSSLDDVFSATYDNYKIIVNTSTSATTSGSIRIHLRASGSDLSLSEYRNGGFLMRATAANANFSGNGDTQWRVADSLISNGTIGLSMDIISPFLAQITKMNYVSSGQDASSINGYVGAGIYGDTASASGVKVAVGAGTITGTISVYGYVK